MDHTHVSGTKCHLCLRSLIFFAYFLRRLPRHLENDLQLDRRTKRKAGHANRQAGRVLPLPKTSCSTSEAPSATFGWSRTSPEIATATPSRTMRVTLSSDPKCSRATARALSAARRAALLPASTSSSAPTRPTNFATRPSVGSIPVRKSRFPVRTAPT